MRKMLLPFALVVALVGSHPGIAHAQELDVDIVLSSATLLDRTHVLVEGVMICGFVAGDEDVIITLRQRGGPTGFREGGFHMTVTFCDPTPIPLSWLVTGGPFHPGEAIFDVEADLCGELGCLLKHFFGTIRIRRA
jgi:hypothetical protein